MITQAVQTRNVMKCFGSHEVLTRCDMNVPEGSIYGFLGANGAGKTTLFKLLAGLLAPDAGSILIMGKDMQKERAAMLSQMGSLIEAPVFYEHLSAQKNLELHLAYMGVSGMGVDKALSMAGLLDVGNKAVSAFSMGMRQRLAIARAFIHKPRLLLLDEPINGLDPMGIREMRELFVQLANEHKMTILLSSHILSEVEHIADRIGVLSGGKIVLESDLAQIKASYQGSLEDYFFMLMNGGERA